MRFAERFLATLALISLAMRFSGMKQGSTMELIALPLLACFYLLVTPFLLNGSLRLSHAGRRLAWYMPLSFLSGATLAYCIISCLYYTLGWIRMSDMVENCGILLGLIFTGSLVGARKTTDVSWRQLATRAAVLFVVIALVALLPLPAVSLLPHKAL